VSELKRDTSTPWIGFEGKNITKFVAYYTSRSPLIRSDVHWREKLDDRTFVKQLNGAQKYSKAFSFRSCSSLNFRSFRWQPFSNLALGSS